MLFRLFVGVAALAASTSAVSVKKSAMPPLPEAVLADLAKRETSEYQTSDWRSDQAVQKRGPPNGLYGIQNRCTSSHCYAFTFDDGPYDHMTQITDTAVSNGFKVTFFNNVYNYDCAFDEPYASALKHAYNSGMQLCSHTATHADLNSLTYAQIDQQIYSVENMMYKILGVVPACFRPPYGDANQTVVDYLNNRHGLVVINWNFDTRDADGSSVADSQTTLRSIKSPKHAIVLMHETIASTAKTLFPSAIKIAKNNGYTTSNFQTIPQSLGFNGYKVVGKPSARDSSWNCNAEKSFPSGN